MLFFRKKDEEEEVDGRKTVSRKPRRKKKEPPKPWTKKERYILLFVLVSTVLISGTLALYAREWKLPGFPRISVSKISFFDSTPIVIDGDSVNVSEEDRKKADQIKKQFRLETKDLSGVYGFYLIDLDSAYGFGIDQKETFQAASLVKLPVMAGMYLKAQRDNFDLDSTYVLQEEDKVDGSGSLYGEPEGYELSYRDLIGLMGKQSDNTSFNVARNLLGDEVIKEVISEFGMENTYLETNETTLEDIGTFFDNLYQSSVLTRQDSEEMLGFLTDTIYELWMAAGIPENVRVAHKFGREIHVVNDGGVVYYEKPFVLVIMSKGVIENEADEVFPELSRSIFSTWVSN